MDANNTDEKVKLKDQSSTSKTEVKETLRPSVFNYTDYREFLKDSFAYKKTINPSYSETAFIKQAGFGANSRGYFSLLMKGKRNLSAKTIVGFSEALKLSKRETQYFEGLVFYNQAKTEKDKTYYFERISKFIKGKETKAYELLKAQYNYFSNWYVIAIRNLAGLTTFRESSEWIIKKLRRKVTKTQVKDAIGDLIELGLFVRDEHGFLGRSNELISFTDNSLNHTVVNNFHAQMLDKAKDSLIEDEYENRSASCVVLSCNSSEFKNIREDIAEFRVKILEKYGTDQESPDSILNMGIQLFHITPVEAANNISE